jgi:hypothetical protein
MCTVPLDLERKLEQRWAARFARQAQSTPEGHKPEKAKAQKTTGLKRQPVVRSAGLSPAASVSGQ